MLHADVCRAVEEIVGRGWMLRDAARRRPYETDWTRRFSGEACLVALPGSMEEVRAILSICRDHGVRVVPQGGNTGLVGGGVPRGGELVLSLTRLDRLEPVDEATMQVVVGAGATLEALQRHADAAGFDAGLDFAARGSATIGGIVATAAGGARALRHGTARARVAGLQAVLANGALVSRLSGLPKDNAGYDLPALLVGSEGTLGVTTAVRWQLVPRLTKRVTALVPLASIEAATALLTRLRKLSCLEAADFFLDDGLQLVLERLRLRSPVRERAAVYLLIECAGGSDPAAELADALDAAHHDDIPIADDTASRGRLWRLREALPEAIAARGIPHKVDVGVPLHGLREFLRRLPEEVGRSAPDSQVFVFGHLGDGNVHVNIVGPPHTDAGADESALRLAVDCGGTISAEHGVGTAKAKWLELARGADEARAMTAIKRALDPDGLLNPGVIFPTASIALNRRPDDLSAARERRGR